MSQPPLDDALLRQYLLGELDVEEQRRLEESLLFDRQSVKRLRLAEEDLLDDYVREELSPRERERFESYFLIAPERRRKLRLAQALRRYIADHPAQRENSMTKVESAPTLRQRLLAWLKAGWGRPAWSLTISIIVLGLVGTTWWLLKPSGMSKGLAALIAAFPQRPFEARISELTHRRWSRLRGEAKTPVDSTALERAMQIFTVEAIKSPGPTTDQALGRLYLMQREFKPAIRHFEKALKARPNDARLHSDLGAAYLELSASEQSDTDARLCFENLLVSRKYLQEALDLDAKLPDALFNLGLWCQRQHLWAQAQESWKHYLEQDASSPWADEARNYLKTATEEEQKQIQPNREQILQDFLVAWQAHDEARAWQLISQNREALTGRLVWWQLTEAFLNASVKGQAEQAESLLHALAYAGAVDREKSTDPFAAELAGYYQHSSASQRIALAQAHELMNQANHNFFQGQYPRGLNYYNQAKDIFEQTGDRWEAAIAEFFLIYGNHYKLEERLSRFTHLAEADNHREHWWLLAQIYSALGSSYFDHTNYSEGCNFTKRALLAAERISDSYAVQKNLAQLAAQYRYLADFDQATTNLQLCQQATSQQWPGPRQIWRNYTTAGQIFSTLGFYAAAADYHQEALSVARSVPREVDPSLCYYSYIELGLIYGQMHRAAQAISFTQQGYKTAQDLEPSTLQIGMLARASLYSGDLYRQANDINRALEYYDQSIKRYESIKNYVYVYGAHKGRLLCYLAQGENVQAQNELDVVLRLAETYRAGIEEEKYRNTFFDAEQSVYDLAIDFEYTRHGNPQAAFNFSELSRARSLLSLIGSTPKAGEKAAPAAQPYNLNEIQARMPERTQIVQYAALEDKLLIWVITKTKFTVVEQKISLQNLESKALTYWRGVSSPVGDAESDARLQREGAELYDLLIAPLVSQRLLESGQDICVVPDKALNYLPFNALVSSASGQVQYLAQQYRLQFAPSATIFVHCSESARERGAQKSETLLSVGDPSFDQKAFPRLERLREAASEARAITQYYPGSSPLIDAEATKARVKSGMSRANVIHFASHYVADERFPRLSKLLLAKGPRVADGVLQAEEIEQKLLPHARLVVLAACSSGIERYYRGEGMIGMSRTFLAARVPLVVASLWPVDSDATAKLMTSFHRHRKEQGYSTSEALRLAQLDLIKDPQRNQRQPFYWAAFVAIGGHADY